MTNHDLFEELDDGMHLVIGTAAARELKSLPPDGELFIITGFGAARKGKSTILTILGDFFTRQSYQLFGEPTFVSEFPIGDSWSTVTDGVWMSYPIPLNAEKTQHIIFLDTEGKIVHANNDPLSFHKSVYNHH